MHPEFSCWQFPDLLFGGLPSEFAAIYIDRLFVIPLLKREN
jgi:hypothetical protein